jgi:hypothetical protein
MRYKKFCMALVVFGTLLCTFNAEAQKSSSHVAPTLAGTWLMQVAPDPSDPAAPPPFAALITFTADGNLFTTETDEQTISQGVWAKIGNHQYALSALQFEFDSPNVWGGTFKIRAKLTLSQNGNSFDGPYHLDFLDTNGNLLFSGIGKLSGSRVQLP